MQSDCEKLGLKVFAARCRQSASESRFMLLVMLSLHQANVQLPHLLLCKACQGVLSFAGLIPLHQTVCPLMWVNGQPIRPSGLQGGLALPDSLQLTGVHMLVQLRDCSLLCFCSCCLHLHAGKKAVKETPYWMESICRRLSTHCYGRASSPSAHPAPRAALHCLTALS